MENSAVMADVYVADRAEQLRASDACDGARAWLSASAVFDQDREQFRQRFTVVAANRGLAVRRRSSMAIFNVIEKADSKVDLPAQLPSRETLASLQEDDPQVKLFPEGNYVAAIVKLTNYDNSYLFIATAA